MQSEAELSDYHRLGRRMARPYRQHEVYMPARREWGFNLHMIGPALIGLASVIAGLMIVAAGAFALWGVTWLLFRVL